MRKPRMIDFLNGKDHGPLTVDEGKRYNREDKQAYLQTRVMAAELAGRPVRLISPLGVTEALLAA